MGVRRRWCLGEAVDDEWGSLPVLEGRKMKCH